MLETGYSTEVSIPYGRTKCRAQVVVDGTKGYR